MNAAPRLDIAALSGPPAGPDPPGIDACGAVLAYEGQAAVLVGDLKFRNRRQLIGRLTRAMAVAAPPGPHRCVTWVPTTVARRRQRGYDQAEVLARGVARHLDLPCVALLGRLDTGHQVGRGRHDRLLAPDFEIRRPVAGAVLLVDDVLTTGGTLAAAAGALRTRGAERVTAVVLARTPLKGSAPTAEVPDGRGGRGGR